MAFKRGHIMTDIHFGKKSNSEIHNQDCLNFLEWFCDEFRNDPKADYVAFLGDWHENRTAIDVTTLNRSYEGAKMLDELGVPVFFVVGNHDLGMKTIRDIYSTIGFHEFKNFQVIHDEPFPVDNMMFVPFIQPDEYDHMFNNHCKHMKIVMGHFEFKDFVLTGYSVIKETGPDIDDYTKQEAILSGHYHKRQSRNNTHYIGNTFPMDFSDTNDNERGYVIFDNDTCNMKFVNWTDGPRYIRGKLSDLLDDKFQLCDNSYVQIEVDIPLDYSEIEAIEQIFNEKFNLRDFKLDDSIMILAALAESDADSDDDTAFTNEQTVVDLLSQTDEKKFDANLLIQIFMDATPK